MAQRGLIFNIQKYSVHDGPGIRTTVFLKGCPLDCPWCHNPESISRKREIIVLESRCITCSECRSACSHGTTAAGTGALPGKIEVCDLCGACVEACPTGARQIVGQEVEAAEVLKVLLQDQAFYEESGGGVTFSGGEPLAQPGFVMELLRSCRALGVNCAIDTCGLVPTSTLLEAAPLTQVFLYDLKVMDDATHVEHTGASNRLILSNLQKLAEVHPRIWIRVPIVPGFNDGQANLEAIARFARTLPNVEQVNLLPFHRTGQHKSLRLGLQNRTEAVIPPGPEAMERARAIFAEEGLKAKLGG